MFKDYLKYDGMGLAELIRKKEVGAGEVMETAIALANAIDPIVNFRSVDCADIGRAAAGKPLPDGPLAGVPYLLKDTFTSWKGRITWLAPFSRRSSVVVSQFARLGASDGAPST